MKQMKDLLQLLLEDKRVKLFVAIVLVVLGGSISFFLYTYNRSFLKHRERLTDIQEFNNRLPVYCSKINVGHDGTTMEFSTLPGNEGPAGTSPLDSGSLSAASPLDQFAIHPLLDMKVGNFFFSFTNPSFFMLLTLSLVLLLISFVTKKGGGNSVHLLVTYYFVRLAPKSYQIFMFLL